MKICKIVIGILILMTFYIIYIAKDSLSTTQIILPWMIFSVSVFINMYFLSEATIIKGLGKVKELQLITIKNTLFDIFCKIILLLLGFKLTGLSIAYLLTAILLSIQYLNLTNKIRKYNFSEYKKALKLFDEQFKNTLTIITNKSKGIGGVLVSNFIQNQLFLLIAPLYLSLELLGSYGLTWQLVSVIGAFSSIPFNAYIMKMGNSMVRGDRNKLKEIFSVTSFIFIIFFVLGALCLALFGKEILRLFKSNTHLLPTIPLILLILQGFIIQSIQKSTTIISLSNNQSYVKSLIISSALIISIQMTIFNSYADLTYLILCNIIIQISYNFWRWGNTSMKLCGVEYKDFVQIPLKKIMGM